MDSQFLRWEMLVGESNVRRLGEARVCVFGAGGVGGYAIEALARAGVGAIDVVDGDVFEATNLNRQLHALHSTLGKPKAEVVCARLADINPRIKATAHSFFYNAQTADRIDLTAFDFVVDAIDMVTAKLLLATECARHGIGLISCMGTGNKHDPTALGVSDLFETSVCPLAKVMRHELRQRGVSSLPVVFSPEQPHKPDSDGRAPSSHPCVPPTAGLLLAHFVLKKLIDLPKNA